MELARRLKIAVEEVVFVGDSWNDVEVFEFTGKGISVHSTNEELRKVVWKEIDSLKQIREILKRNKFQHSGSAYSPSTIH